MASCSCCYTKLWHKHAIVPVQWPTESQWVWKEVCLELPVVTSTHSETTSEAQKLRDVFGQRKTDMSENRRPSGIHCIHDSGARCARESCPGFGRLRIAGPTAQDRQQLLAEFCEDILGVKRPTLEVTTSGQTASLGIAVFR